jgi:hypothetical protein
MLDEVELMKMSFRFERYVIIKSDPAPYIRALTTQEIPVSLTSKRTIAPIPAITHEMPVIRGLSGTRASLFRIHHPGTPTLRDVGPGFNSVEFYPKNYFTRMATSDDKTVAISWWMECSLSHRSNSLILYEFG